MFWLVYRQGCAFSTIKCKGFLRKRLTRNYSSTPQLVEIKILRAVNMPTPSEPYGKCKFDNCPILASFGPSASRDSRERQFCSLHKMDGMTNIINPICIHPDCLVQASFGTPMQKKLYCTRHKRDGMVHVRKQRDVEIALPLIA